MKQLVPEVSIGVFGHVDHGKTTLVYALTGRRTDVHSEEQLRAMTIRLGYAHATFYKCPNCEEYPYTRFPTCPKCGSQCEPTRAVSFVDAPGHEALMATALAGTALIDGALLVVAANEGVKEQTREHLMAIDIAGIDKVIVVQTKLDLVTPEEAKQNYEEIRKSLEGTIAENAPIIPVAAPQHVNIDALIEAIETYIPTPEREENAKPIFLAARSFDINKPGAKPSELKGGVLGGALLQGKLSVNEAIEIAPGTKEKGKWRALETTIESLRQGNVNVKEAKPGGLVGILTKLDPSLTKSDSLAGNVVTRKGELPEFREELKLGGNLVREVKFTRGEPIMLTAGVTRTIGIIESVHQRDSEIELFVKGLRIPVAILPNARIVLSKLINNSWRLVGYATPKD